jgi:hypothetical protein
MGNEMSEFKFGHGDKVPYGDKFLETFDGCIVCGAVIRKEEFFLNVTTNSTIWSAAEGQCDESIDQGWFVVGSDCAKKFAKGVLGKVGA